MLETLNNAANWILELVMPLTRQNPMLLLTIGGFITACVLLYCFTKGREFMIVGCSALLFFVPFIKFA